MTDAATTIVEAIAALSRAAGHLYELDRAGCAHRCDMAAARLQLMVEEEAAELPDEEPEP